MSIENYVDYKDRLRNLLLKMDISSAEEGMSLLDTFVKEYEASLYNEIGRLTRQLHTSLATFHADGKIANLTKEDIPSAKERLKYVVELTEQAADKVLAIIEQSLPISLEISDGANDLQNECEKNTKQKDFWHGPTTMPTNIEAFIVGAKKKAAILHGHLTEILMAQEYQDITGQIIKKVIDLVQDVEDNLIRLIKITGQNASPQAGESDRSRPSGPCVPGVDNNGEYAAGQDDVDQLLASLGF